MEEILKTTLLEFEKSTFLIDLVKYNSGKQYIRILQRIHDEESSKKRSIKINPSILSDILRVLISYNNLIPGGNNKHSNNDPTNIRVRNITDSDKLLIQNRYLKGVPISDLSIQFDCEVELIKQILYNSNVEIVDNVQKKRRRSS